MSPNFLDKLRKKPLDASRRESVFRLYDEERGYQQYHDTCKSIYGSNLQQTEDDILFNTGVEHVPILDESVATEALETILEKADGTTRKENIDYSEILHVEDWKFIQTLFGQIFSPALDKKLNRYFHSDYVVYWFTFLRAIPSFDSRRSFLWHCDKGPSSHLKILLYLNGTEEHGGNTEFLDRGMTEQFTESGYLFGPVDARQKDLSNLARNLDIDYRPKKWAIRPGEGIIFEPSKVLHRGNLTNPRAEVCPRPMPTS